MIANSRRANVTLWVCLLALGAGAPPAGADEDPSEVVPAIPIEPPQTLLEQPEAIDAALAALPAYPDHSAERARFQQAMAQLASGQRDELDAALDALTRYPLYRYLAFEVLADRIRNTTPGPETLHAIQGFHSRHADETLTRRLVLTLQQRAAMLEDWPLTQLVGKEPLASNLTCTRLRATAEISGLAHWNDDALAVWTDPTDPHERCADTLKSLESRVTPPISAIWARIYNAMEEDRPAYAEPMLRYLGTGDRNRVQSWIEAHQNQPEKLLQSGVLDENTQLNRRMVVDLVLRWSKRDPVAAMNHWLKVKNRYTFYSDRYYDTHRLLAMRGAYRRLPEALGWLDGVPAREDDLELLEWRIRAALLAGDWPGVLSRIEALPQAEQEEDHWAYWVARALEKTGHKRQARKIYRELAGLQSWHGFLSADRLSQDYILSDDPIPVDPETLQLLASLPALHRAREYFAVGLATEGRREWQGALADADQATLGTAAVLAHHWDLVDRAIANAGAADQRRAISYRFPLRYENAVGAAATANDIDRNWIYGVIRRESAFMPDALSSAGARGLMQLMPATAQHVAKMRGLKDWAGDLNDPEQNIPFGAYYLRHVLDQFEGREVLATAAYNAGPNRVTQWLPTQDMEGDRWVDVIPYSETRRYVRAVLAYATIYEWQRNGRQQPRRLREYLNTIQPAPSGADGTDKDGEKDS